MAWFTPAAGWAGVLAVAIVAPQLQACGDDGSTLQLPQGGTGGSGPAKNVGEEMFRALEEEMLDTCGTCHKKAGSADTPFLGDPKTQDPDPYVAITSWPGIIVKDADSSLLVTWPSVGNHTGGPTNIAFEKKLIAWLEEEAKAVAATDDGDPVLPPFRPIVPGFNAVYLDVLGEDFVGMAVTFQAEELTDRSIQLLDLQVHPTTKLGLHLEHPLFTVYPEASAEGEPDPVDSFSNVTLDAPAGESQTIGPGEVILTNWLRGGKLSLAFEKIEVVDPMGGEGGGGSIGGACDALQAFIDNAAPQLATCAGCHDGTNPTATNAVDMSELGSAPDVTCGQIKNRVNLGNPAASQLFVTTDPNGSATHPYKFLGNAQTFNTFVNAVSVWIQQEAQ
jgi:cytochrome c553